MKSTSSKSLSFGPRFSFFRLNFERLLSAEYFNFKLLIGTAVGVSVIILLAITCFLLTYQNQQEARFRAHAIGVVRLSSILENDIAALENAHRGFLLTHKAPYSENFERRQALFQKHSQDLALLAQNETQERKRILKLRQIVWNWSKEEADAMKEPERFATQKPGELLGASMLDKAREILHRVERDEQILLNQRVQEREWEVQSTQVLDFIPRLERAVYEMQKEKRGYILTGDPAFIESYKRATANFYTFQGHLSVLVADAPAQLTELEQIRSSVERWIIESAVPDIEAKRAGKKPGVASRSHSEAIMTDVRRRIDAFAKEQTEVYELRSAAAAHQRILTTTGIDILCALATLLMVGSGCYSFVVSRRQFKKLEGADARIRLVIDNILDGMITFDKDGAIISMNPAALRMFGYSEEESIGQSFTELIPKCFGLSVGGSLCPCEWSAFGQRTGGVTLALAQTRGRINFPVEISLSETIADKQKFYIAMVRDITERRRFEEEIAAERNSLAVTLGSIGDGVITADLNGRILISNPACAAMTGWSPAEAEGQKLKTVLNIAAEGTTQSRGKCKTYRSEAEAILLGTPERSTLTARDGTQRTIEQVAAPIEDSKKKLSGVVLVFRDITDRLRDEAERRKAEMLEQLGLLAGGIAHDFNNLLTSIIGNISLISMLAPPNDELSGRLNDAKNASLRARDLAQQLLTFARGGAPIKKAASIAKLIEDTVSFSLRGSQSRSEIQIASELWPAEFDPGQISQVIANLVVNADQAMPDGGTLRVGCENFSTSGEPSGALHELPAGDYIRIQVRDEGIGIPSDCLKRIFDPYFTTKDTGNGLGLATTYSIVKNHGGLVTVESEPYKGATFTVYLPAVAEHAQPAPVVLPDPPVEKPIADLNGNGRVLIVDDEEAIRALVDFTLGRLGYEVSEAGTAVEGIELYRAALEQGRRFDLVILDLTLPGGMGGKEALKKLIEIDPTVTAIVSSGYATDATMSRYEDLGFRGVITKPYEAADLGRTVQEIIQSSRLECEPEYELQHAC
ncbi:MAG TPA: PAS domain S-box protein [Chthoniobacterales bacterium]|jgi:PAS domain S-box-containing protein